MLGGEKPQSTVNQLTSALAQELGGRFARSVGVDLASTTGTENTVTKGIKGIGSGIKRLFGKKK